jgi:hypothetical protein
MVHIRSWSTEFIPFGVKGLILFAKQNFKVKDYISILILWLKKIQDGTIIINGKRESLPLFITAKMTNQQCSKQFNRYYFCQVILATMVGQ